MSYKRADKLTVSWLIILICPCVRISIIRTELILTSSFKQFMTKSVTLRLLSIPIRLTLLRHQPINNRRSNEQTQVRLNTAGRTLGDTFMELINLNFSSRCVPPAHPTHW